MTFKSSLVAAAVLLTVPFGAIAQSGVDLALAQTSATTPAVSPAGSMGTTFTKPPPATTAPYQSGAAPSYSSWPPAASTSPGYRSTQPTYQSNSPLVTTSAAAGTPAGATPGSTAACAPTSPIGASPTAGTTAGTCP